MSKIIYEPHPVSESRKAKLQAEGYKILDAIFAPAGTPIHQELHEEVASVEAEVEAEAETEEEAEDSPAKRGRPKKG